MARKVLRRFVRKLKYMKASERLLAVIVICIWFSCVSLYTISHKRRPPSDEYAYIDDGELFLAGSDDLQGDQDRPYRSVVHRKIDEWHRQDGSRKPLLHADGDGGVGVKWKTYPEGELFAWTDVPLHSVRAVVDNNKTYLGEMGEAVKVPWHMEDDAKRRWSEHQLNVVASEQVSLNRRLPDVRRPECRDAVYPKRLPKATVIVVFFNEAWSTLLRTVHSVINRSPPSLLTEVLLVDDFSDRSK